LLFWRTTLLVGCAAVGLMAQTEDQGAEPEYGGPAILSRGQTPGSQSEAPIAFRPYVGINGVYDSGVVPVSVTSTGAIPFTDEEGVELSLGAYLNHAWKRTTLGLNYTGDFRHYTIGTYDGTDQLLALILKHQPSKHVEFTLRNQAGTYSWNFLQPNSLGLIDSNYLQTPQNDLFYNPVFYVSTAGDLTYQMTSRLSFNLGGEGDLIRHRASALYGVTSSSARGDVEYRATRHTTIGLDYHFNHYDFTGEFGSSNINSVGVNVSRQLTRHMQLSARIGGARVQTSSLAEVPIDPAVAALIGETVGIQAAYHLNYAPDASVRLINDFQRGQFTASYTNGVTPGNGVYLTSRIQSGEATYHYTGIRYWNFGVNGVYSRLSALAQTLAAFDTYGGGVGVTRELGKGLHAVARLDVRRYNIGDNFYLHTEYRATFGFTFSPGEVPLALW
jgi:hypothetical protein